MRESFNTVKRLGIGLAILSGAVACSNSKEPETTTTTAPQAETIVVDNEPEISYFYYPNGTREIQITGLIDLRASVNRVFQYCDGPDLIEQTENGAPNLNWAGGGISRSVKHPACDDGLLTENDFIIPKSK